MTHYSIAQKIDTEAISRLLESSKLPFSDIRESQVKFIVAKENDKIVGCIGLEIYGTEGLLRSFAVENNYRNRGIGKDLYNSLLAYSTENHISTLHLLTNTAREYFSKVGFMVANRSKAPETISKSSEFGSLCPSSATYMVLEDVLVNLV